MEDQECGFLRKIAYEHVCLTTQSVLIIRIAVQGFSLTVSKVLSNYGQEDAAGTAKFCLMFDTVFDIMNVSCTATWSCELKPFIIPFSFTYDPQFSWQKLFFKIFWKTGFNQLNKDLEHLQDLRNKKCLYHRKQAKV